MEKRKPLNEMSDSEKLNYLIEKIERIDRTINPSFGRRMLAWVRTHWIILLSLGSILSILIGLWDEIQVVLKIIRGIQETVESMGSGAHQFSEQFGNAKDQLFEGGKKLFDFWR